MSAFSNRSRFPFFSNHASRLTSIFLEEFLSNTEYLKEDEVSLVL